MNEPFWITKEMAIAMHDRQLAEHGGGSGVRDEGLLESALTRPQNQFLNAEEKITLPYLAAGYAYGIASNHPFIDGSKRTALVASRTFLLLNGMNLDASPEEKYSAIRDLAESRWTEDQLTEWFTAYSVETSG